MANLGSGEPPRYPTTSLRQELHRHDALWAAGILCIAGCTERVSVAVSPKKNSAFLQLLHLVPEREEMAAQSRRQAHPQSPAVLLVVGSWLPDGLVREEGRSLLPQVPRSVSEWPHRQELLEGSPGSYSRHELQLPQYSSLASREWELLPDLLLK